MRSFSPDHIFMSAIVANADGLAMNVADYESVIVTIYTSNSTDATLNFQASQEREIPAFTTARSATNRWHYIDAVALDGADGDIIGGTGRAFGGTDETGAAYNINTSGMNWLSCELSSYVAGTVTVYGKGYSNNA